MADVAIYEKVGLDGITFEEQDGTFYYPCPCGDLFELKLEKFLKGERIAECPSCSLKVFIIVTEENLRSFREECPNVLPLDFQA